MPGGLDYLFFRFAKPNVKQEAATIESIRKFGLEVETGSSPEVAWDAEVIGNYFAYGDWANDRLLSLIESLDDAALDRAWGIGKDTIRNTALHLADAERWWLKNWTSGSSQFEPAPKRLRSRTCEPIGRGLLPIAGASWLRSTTLLPSKWSLLSSAPRPFAFP